MTYKITYSASVYGKQIIYYLGILKTIYDLPNRHFVIHTNDESKKLFLKLAQNSLINLSNVDFIEHNVQIKSKWDCMWWRYYTLEMDYDIVHMIDTDTVSTNLDKYYFGWFDENPQLDYLVMHLNKNHWGYMGGSSSFRLCNINKKIIDLIIKTIKNSNNISYGKDELILWDILKPFFSVKGLLYKKSNNINNVNDFKKWENKPFTYWDCVPQNNQFSMFNPSIINNQLCVVVDGFVYPIWTKKF